MLHECDERKGGSCTGNSTGYDGIHLIYAGGHCHAPSCISMELFNADTGKRLCHHAPVYGESHEVNLNKACLLVYVHIILLVNVFFLKKELVGYKFAFRSHVHENVIIIIFFSYLRNNSTSMTKKIKL